MRLKLLVLAPAASALLVLASPAQAQPAAPVLRLNAAADTSIFGAAVAMAIGSVFIPVDTTGRLDAELLPFDQSMRGRFSESANDASNALIFAQLLLPIAVQASLGVDARFAESMVVYGESLVVSGALNALTKRLVSRPRPYVYSDDPLITRWAEGQGDDSRLSFYSGHSALAFTAAVSGAYLYGMRSDDRAARAAIWGFEIAFAAATANLRARAGRHFYSDIVVGAVTGGAVGLLVPLLHRAEGVTYAPSAAEWGAMAGGLLAGVLVSELLPFDNDVSLPLALVPSQAGGETSLSLVLDLRALWDRLGA